MTPPYDTLQLTVTPRDANGNVITAPVSVTYTSGHSSVEVSPTGLLTAKTPRPLVQIIVRVSYKSQSRADTVFVRVTETAIPPQLVSYGFDVSPDDSLKVAAGASLLVPTERTFRVRGADSNGPISNLIAKLTSSDPTIVSIDPVTGQLTAIRPGKVTLYAVSTVYGVTWQDSLTFTSGYPLFAQVVIAARTPINSPTVVATFDPGTLPVGTGALVMFLNTSGETVDVVFDEPDKVDAYPVNIPPFLRNDELPGNIPPFAPDSTGVNTRFRIFNHPGVYPFRSILHGTMGKIVVQ